MLRALVALLLLVSAPAHAGDVSGVPSVTDADTLRFGDVRVRIWGIDAPEMNTAAGVQARDWLTSADVAWMLVRAGHARDWPRYSKGYYAQ